MNMTRTNLNMIIFAKTKAKPKW